MNEKQTILSASTSPSDEIDIVDDSEVELREFHIPSELHGERIDKALAVLLPELSRSYAKQLLEEGAVAILRPEPQVMQKASAKVRSMERFLVTLLPTPQSQAFKPEVMDITQVFEDEHLRVIYKPAGLVVHPAPGNWSGTLLNGLLALDDKAIMLPRAGIVHRLDKDTSGLMVVAKTRTCMDALVGLIGNREVHREYLAVAYRAWNGPRTREVEAGIGRDTRNRLRMAVVDLERVPGKTAHTSFASLDSNEAACLVHCTLHTGRTHQIRVHMAHIGHPLLGDSLYAGPMQMGIERQALHAFRLSFEHPVAHQALKFEAELPADMQTLLVQLGLKLVIPEPLVAQVTI